MATARLDIIIAGDARRALLEFARLNAALTAFGNLATQVAARALRQLIVALPETIRHMVEMHAQAQVLGMTTQQWTALAYAARQSEVALEDLAQAGRFVIAQGKALLPTLLATAEAISQLDSRTQRANLAAETFGLRFGAKLVPLLNQGSAGIRLLMREAEQLGITFSGETGAAMKDITDELTRIKTEGAAVLKQLAMSTGPVLLDLAKAIYAFVQGIRNLFAEVRRHLEKLGPLMESLKWLREGFEGLSMWGDIWMKRKRGEIRFPGELARPITREELEEFRLRREARLARERALALQDDLDVQIVDERKQRRAALLNRPLPEAGPGFTRRGFVSAGEAQMINRTLSFQRQVSANLNEIVRLLAGNLPKLSETLS